MPLPIPQTLNLTQQFREKLEPKLRAEFDQLAASLQTQIPGIGVVRHCDASEIVLTGGNTSAGVTGEVTRNADVTLTHLSYAMILRELMLVNFCAFSATLTGAPTFLRVKIPGGYQVKAGEYMEIPGIIQDAGATAAGRVILNGSVFPAFTAVDQINVARMDGTALTAGSIGARFQIMIPVEIKPSVS